MEPRSRIRGGTVRKTGALGLSGFESRDFHEHVGCGVTVAHLLVTQTEWVRSPSSDQNVMGQYRHKGLSAEQRAVLCARQHERDQALQHALRASRTGKNYFARMLEMLCADPLVKLERAQNRDLVIQQGFQLIHGPEAREVYRALLLHLEGEGCENLIGHAPYALGIAQLAIKFKYFLRPVEDWSRPGRNMHKQFSLLVRHCLARYDVPEFMDQAWCVADAHDARYWFIDIGTGHNIRHSRGLPITLTKRMAHQFLRAPSHFRIEEALRWAQITGQSGDDRVAQAIIATRIGRNGFAHEDYWSGVIGFFLNHPFTDARKMGEVVDFLANRLEAGESVDVDGRTTASLIRLSDAWHHDINRMLGKVVDRQWQRSHLMDARYVVGKAQERITWKVTELLSLQALVDEGRAMQHCVSSYGTACSRRVTAIFRITAEDAIGNVERAGTIEVQLGTSRIVQAKAKRNTQLTPKARAVMEKWAYREALTINEQL